MKVAQTLILIFALFAFYHAKAGDTDAVRPKDHSNFIKLSHGGIYIPKAFPFYKPYFGTGDKFSSVYVNLDHARQYRFMTIGGSYERRVYGKLFAGVAYMQWKDVFAIRGTRENFYVNVADVDPIRYIGQVATLVNYKMADLYLFYRQGTNNGRHYFNAGAGASYCWGRNDVVTAYWINPVPPSDAVMYTKAVDAHYWGVVPYIAYDYLFWNNHISIGPDIRARFYPGRSPAEYNVNFHFGVNF